MSRQARLISDVIIVVAVIVCHPASAPGQAGTQKTPATGTISGRVTVGGKAAVNVSVAANSIEAMNARLAPAKTVTDVEGRYRLTGLPPAQYQIIPLAPELTAADEAQEGSGFIFAPASKSVTLAAGEEVENIDLKLVRGGVITGRVTDGNGKPVVEEFITLLPVDEKGTQSRNLQMPFRSDYYSTDDRGIYRIYGLPPGRYKVSAGMEPGGGTNYARSFYSRMFYPDTPDQNKAGVVELAEGGEATGIDIQVGALEKTYSASGRVVDAETGQPIAGVRLSYFINPKNPGGGYSPMYVDNSTSSRGSFQIAGLSPGNYGVSVSSEYSGGDYYSDIVYFEVFDKDVTGVEVRATHGLTLSGLVVAEGDAQGGVAPKLERMRIFAWAQGNDPQARNGGTSAVAPDGSFRIGGLRPGRFSFYFYPMGMYSGRPTISRIERDGIAVTTGQGVELQAGQSASNLRIVINYGTGTIRGAITFVGGVLPSDSRLIIRCSREGKQESGGAYVDSRGRFLITGLAPGTYEVTLQVIRNMNEGPPTVPPQKQIVQVSNESESEANFVVDLTPKERP